LKRGRREERRGYSALRDTSDYERTTEQCAADEGEAGLQQVISSPSSHHITPNRRSSLLFYT
jgi:hypothetical protein